MKVKILSALVAAFLWIAGLVIVDMLHAMGWRATNATLMMVGAMWFMVCERFRLYIQGIFSKESQ